MYPENRTNSFFDLGFRGINKPPVVNRLGVLFANQLS
jgi:hypothetical protein